MAGPHYPPAIVPTERDQLQQAIAAVEAQRGVLGDAVVDAAFGSMRSTLAALGAPGTHEPEQVLKQVSILFLDMVGSTTLSQRLDPEEIHAVIDDALARCTRVVHDHQGKVLKYAGDSLLAVFGAEQSHEDDAERAVHCGLALLAAGPSLNHLVDEWEPSHRAPFSGFQCHQRVTAFRILPRRRPVLQVSRSQTPSFGLPPN